MSIRLNITAEGHAEERFIKDTLVDHLIQFDIYVDVRRVLTSRYKRKSYRGGLINYKKAKRDIETWLKEDKKTDARFSTMFDLYALPKDFPKFEDAQKINDPYEKVAFLEKAMKEDIDDWRFIPYIQLHEFEALVLSNPRNLELEYIKHEKAIKELEKVLATYKGNPELINDKRETAPSKRIEKVIPEYKNDKVSVGAVIAGIDGIEPLKEKCKHFRKWVEVLENLKTSK